MDFLQTLIMFVHVIAVITLIALVLIQHGKGADAGAAFGGGASQTVFGSQGSTGFLTKMTATLGVVFFITSFALAIFAKDQAAVAASGALGGSAQTTSGQQKAAKTSAPAAQVKTSAPATAAPTSAQSSTAQGNGATSGKAGESEGSSSKQGSGSGQGSGIPKLH